MGCSRCGQSRQVALGVPAPTQKPIAETKPEELASSLDAPQDVPVTASTLDGAVDETPGSESEETLPPDLPPDTEESHTIESMQAEQPTVEAEAEASEHQAADDSEAAQP